MKFDMGGPPPSPELMALAERQVKRNVVGIIGLVENMPDGNAQRPGDVVMSMAGKTIEVINTDAEGGWYWPMPCITRRRGSSHRRWSTWRR